VQYQISASITWCHMLSNGNFIVDCPELDEIIILDFFKKMWTELYFWIFLGNSDLKSIFSTLLKDVICYFVHSTKVLAMVS
jgi:hypothetical protein